MKKLMITLFATISLMTFETEAKVSQIECARHDGQILLKITIDDFTQNITVQNMIIGKVDYYRGDFRPDEIIFRERSESLGDIFESTYILDRPSLILKTITLRNNLPLYSGENRCHISVKKNKPNKI